MKQRSPRWFFFFFLGMAPLVAFGWIAYLYLSAPAAVTAVLKPENSLGPEDVYVDDNPPFKIYTDNTLKIAQARDAGMLDFSSSTEVSCDQQTVFLKQLWTHQGKPVVYRITTEGTSNSYRKTERGFEGGLTGKKIETAYYEIPSGNLFAYLRASSNPAEPPVKIVFDKHRQPKDVSNGWDEPPFEWMHFAPISLSFHRPAEDFKAKACPNKHQVQAEPTYEIGAPEVNPPGSFPLSHINWNATLKELKGTDTDQAIAIGVVTNEDALEYCRRDPGGESEGNLTPEFLLECVQSVLKEEDGKTHTSSAACFKRVVSVDRLGTFQGTELPEVKGGGYLWTDTQTGEELMGMISGEATVSAHHEILCPLTH